MKWTTSLPRLPLNPTTMSSRGWFLTLDVILMSMGLKIGIASHYPYYDLCMMGSM